MTCRLSTTLPFGFDFDTRRFIEAYKGVGCESGQYYRNLLNAPSVREIRAVSAACSMPIDSIHGVFGWRYDPSSPDEEMRRFCLEQYELEGALARDLGDPMVVVHPSANRADMIPYEASDAKWHQTQRWGHLDDFMRRLADIGERLGVTYLIENVPFMFPLGHDAPALARRILGVGSERLRMCFDTGHAHITGSTPDDLRACAGAIAYVHVNDNDGVADSHLMPGDGTIDWAAVSAAVRETELAVPMMLEVFYPEFTVEELTEAGLAERLACACATPSA
ncbi:MAG: sugar phosphate isomerase/epimerase family protein [Phycisphaerales bacterium]